MVPTMWDAIDAGEVTPADAGVWPDTPLRPTVSVEAPCCGKRRSADDVWDLRSIPGTVAVLTRPGRRHAHDLQWGCTECRSTLFRRGGWRESQVVRALGGSPRQVRAIRAREMANEDRARKRGRDEPTFRWDDAMQSALAELPTGTVDLPGTARPQ